MEKDKIIDRIMKVKALAERGTDGERAAAEKLLKELMDKYGITEADIDSEKVEYHLLKTGSEEMFMQLFSQIFHLRFGRHAQVSDIRKMSKKDKKILSDAGLGDKDAEVAFQCTYAEFIELKPCSTYTRRISSNNWMCFNTRITRRTTFLSRVTMKCQTAPRMKSKRPYKLQECQWALRKRKYTR